MMIPKIRKVLRLSFPSGMFLLKPMKVPKSVIPGMKTMIMAEATRP